MNVQLIKLSIVLLFLISGNVVVSQAGSFHDATAHSSDIPPVNEERLDLVTPQDIMTGQTNQAVANLHTGSAFGHEIITNQVVNDTTPPEIISPGNTTLEDGGRYTITWEIGDQNSGGNSSITLFFDNYEVRRVGWSSNRTFTYYIDAVADGELGDPDLGVGTYNLTLVVTDNYGNSAIDEIFLTIEDTTAPSIRNYDTEVIVDEGESVYIPIQGTIDANSDTVTLSYTNGTVITTQRYQGHPIGINPHLTIEKLPIGVYEVYLNFTDTQGHYTVSPTITVIVLDPDEPTISSHTDLSISTQNSSYTFEWKPESLAPDRYTISLDGEEVANGTWDSGEIITYEYQVGSPGEYLLNITVYDRVNNTASNLVLITVEAYSSSDDVLSLQLWILLGSLMMSSMVFKRKLKISSQY